MQWFILIPFLMKREKPMRLETRVAGGINTFVKIFSWTVLLLFFVNLVLSY